LYLEHREHSIYMYTSTFDFLSTPNALLIVFTAWRNKEEEVDIIRKKRIN